MPLEDFEDLPHNNPQLEEIIGQKLQLEHVLQALQVLSEDRREAIILHIFSEVSVEEVAEVMHKSKASIYMLLHRGLNDLKQRLKTGDES